MKLSLTNAYRRGLAMTEYLIILGIVAIAAIVFVSIFGKQVKNSFTRDIQALAGQTPQAADTASAGKAVTDSAKGETMGTYQTHAAEQN